VLAQWRDELLKFLESGGPAYQAESLHVLIDSLIADAMESEVEATALQAYLAAVLEVPGGVIANTGRQLWRLGLFRDDTLLGGTLGARLEMNRDTVDLITYPPEGPAAQRQLQRLESSQSPVAKAALDYRKTLDVKHLREIDLGDLRSILESGD